MNTVMQPFILLLVVATYAGIAGCANEAEVETVDVVVATVYVPSGDEITAEMLEVVQMPVGQGRESWFRSKEQIVGRRYKYPLFSGEPIMAAKLAEQESIAAATPQGRAPENRPFHVEVTDECIKRLSAGDRVDVRIAKAQTVTTVATNVELLSKNEDTNTVVLRLTPKQIKTLKHAQQTARNQAGTGVVPFRLQDGALIIDWPLPPSE